MSFFVDFDPFGEPPTFPEVTDEEYEANLAYIDNQLAIVNKRFSQIGSKRISKTRLSDFQTRESMNSLGPNWKAIFDVMLQVACEISLENQLIFSAKSIRKTLTKDEIIRRMEILEIKDAKSRERILKAWEKYVVPYLGV